MFIAIDIMIKYQLFLVLFLLTSITLSAQQSDQDKKSSAKQLIYNARFDEALQILKGSGQLTEKDEEARYLSCN